MKETYRRLQAAKTWPETEALAGKLAALAGARGAADVKTLAGKVAQACRAAMRDTDFEHGGRSRFNKALERLRAAVAAYMKVSWTHGENESRAVAHGAGLPQELGTLALCIEYRAGAFSWEVCTADYSVRIAHGTADHPFTAKNAVEGAAGAEFDRRAALVLSGV